MKFSPVKERIVVRQHDPAIAARLARECGVPPAIGAVLACRGFTTLESCEQFFRPELSRLHDPFLFGDMEKAADRIAAAIADHETIALYGDYDVDGVTATAILVRFLREAGAHCVYHLPNRLTDGYGIHDSGIVELANAGAAVIISVDCGISAHGPADLARSMGIDLIITDHHEPKESLPRAFAVIDPKVDGCGYPDRDLAGVGVALKLCQALASTLGRPDDSWQQYLDLAAVGTAADIVPLTGENRIIVKFGFEQLASTRNLGMRTLMEERKIAGKTPSTSDVVFMVAPCMNAVGRLGDPRRGVELLLTADQALAAAYARELAEANTERRAIDARVQEEAIAWVMDNCEPERDFAIVAGHQAWHCGVIGIAASKVIERFHRPTILFTFGDDGTARGSGRSVPGLHLLEALDECSSLLESYGGHAAAAGMVVRLDKLNDFRAAFNDAVKKRLTADDLSPRITADAEVTLSEMTRQCFAAIRRMEPFGPGNMRPVLVCRNLRHKWPPRIVGDKHLKMTVTDDGRNGIDAIGFGFGRRLDEVAAAPAFSMAFSLDENEWNGRISLQLKIKGIAS
jgi:single-stranded-DNA-specific exonuclease